MSYDSLLQSIQKVCVLVTFAYLLSRTGLFRRLFQAQYGRRDRIWILLFFGLLGLVEFGLSPLESPGSSRIVAVTVAGLLGGPLVGIGVAFIVGLTGLLVIGLGAAYGGVAAAVGGVLGGWVADFRPHLQLRVVAGFVVGALSHTVWMGLVFAQDTLVATWDVLAILYGGPIILNGLAVALFLMIVGDMRAQQEKLERAELARALHIGNSVLPHLKYGLNAKSAGYIADIIRRVTGVSSVAITDAEKVLASTDGRTGELPQAARCAVDARSMSFGSDACGFECAAPLFYDDKVVGCVELRQIGSKIRPEVAELGTEIAQFLGNYQLQLWHLERQSEIASKAELRALQAQVHPHFLFNALNTLACLCETNPRKAADIAVRLGDYFRTALKRDGTLLIPLSKELANVRHYLEIEQARFGERLVVSEEVEESVLDTLVPALSIQPLVENAVLHGLSTKVGKGNLKLVVRRKESRLRCAVIDNGTGMTPERLENLLHEDEPRGLTILRGRLDKLYHSNFSLRIRSRQGMGTLVLLSIPVEREHYARDYS